MVREATPDDLPLLLRLAYPAACPGSSLRKGVEAEWTWLWNSQCFCAAVVEDESGSGIALMGATLLSDDFYRRLTKAHKPYINRRLAREREPGDAPFPSASEIVAQTGALFINYLSWKDEGDAQRAWRLRGRLTNGFAELYGGYPAARLVVEVVGTGLRDLAIKTGAKVVNSYMDWSAGQSLSPAEQPFLLSLERQAAMDREDHWYERIFADQPPVLALRDPQKALLRLARHGMQDPEIGERLGIGRDGVRGRWRTIYDRFRDRLPGTVPIIEEANREVRGKGKRQAVLRYIRAHPEELRPDKPTTRAESRPP